MKARRATPRRREAPRWTAAEWQAAGVFLVVRWGGKCPVCREMLREPVERHHRKRRRDGGDSFPNILALHRACHQWVTEHPEEATERGLIVPMWGDPTATPVLVDGVPWDLDEGGSVSRVA